MISILKNLIKKYIYIFFIILIPYFVILNKSLAVENNFLVENLEVSENFDLSFSKDKVIEKAFFKAFNNLLYTILMSKDLIEVKKTDINQIKQLVENFKIKNEKFINNKYYANFDVNFDKKKISKFLESKKLFISIPNKIDLFFLPIVIENNSLLVFDKNLFYKNWAKKLETKHLINYILPIEDIYELEKYISQSNNLENLDMLSLSKKYNLDNFILSLIYYNDDQINVFSKIKFEDQFMSTNLILQGVDLKNEISLDNYIKKIKISYEDIWKKKNQINTSIKLKIQIFLNSNDYNEIKRFEEVLNKIDLINSFRIKKITLNQNIYEISYSGNPKDLIAEFSNFNIPLIYDEQNWIVQ